MVRAFLIGAVLAVVCASPVRAAGSQDAVLAIVGKYKITEQEVDSKLRAQLASLEIQLYELKKSAVQEMADDYLLQQAARKEHLSVDAYLKKELDSKVAEPSDAEIRKAYGQLDNQFRPPYEQAKPDLVAKIKDQARGQARHALLEKLRAEHGVKILLRAPRFEVATAGRPSAGAETAPVTIVEFEDFQNPYCRRAEDILKQVRAKYGDKLRVVYADFPAASHPAALDAARAARCAGEQGQFWPFHDALFADQSKMAANDLKAIAARLKLDMAKFNLCFAKHNYDGDIHNDMEEGQSLGVEGTPAFFINGRPLLGPQPPEKFDQVIDEELGASTKQARK